MCTDRDRDRLKFDRLIDGRPDRLRSSGSVHYTVHMIYKLLSTHIRTHTHTYSHTQPP